MNTLTRIIGAAAFAVLVLNISIYAFQEIPDDLPEEVKARLQKLKDAKDDPKKGQKKDKPKFKKYEEVITKKTKTKKGIFTTHEVDDKLYYEFDPVHFGKEFLWLVQVAKVEAGRGLGGLEARRLVVKFERIDDSILIRNVSHRLRAKKGSAEEFAVQASSIDGIIAALKIVTFGPKKTPVVEMTKIFKGDVAELSPKRALNAMTMDRTKVFLTSVKPFEKNIETRVLATYRRRPPRSLIPGSRPPDAGNVTAEIHHSMVALPDKPMRPRYRDRRVGFFSGSYLDFSSDKNMAERVTLIRRWRLEKKTPSAAMSEPVKPIIYYVGRGVPKKWRQATIEGIEMWQPAFEKAGFKNAIIGKIAPTRKENPNWDAEDARYSTVRWLASEIRNAFGPHVQDPRSGEILEADVRMFHNIMALLQDWYFVQAGASDPRAAKLPLPDELMSELVRYVVAHEVGHTLGLQHNMLGNNAYPVESYRDPNFVKQFGMSSSIMDYSRFNYIAQPEDNAVHIPNKVGPYDHFAIEWGYKEFDNSKPVKEDTARLNTIAARQLDDPRLRFGSFGDPRAQTEDIGDDAVKATSYGLKNLERVAEKLVAATTENGKDFTRLNRSYGTLVNQMNRELRHVAAYVGGVERDNLVAGLSRSDTFRPTPVVKQKEALQFVLEHGLHTKSFLLRKDIIQRIGIDSAITRISGAQSSLVRRILSNMIVSRNANLEAGGYQVYSSVEIFDDMRKGVFAEIYAKDQKPDVFRRNLHRATIDHLATGLNPPAPRRTGLPASIAALNSGRQSSSDYKALCRATLTKLRGDISKASSKTKDDMTRIHYRDLVETIRQALSGK